MVYKFIISYMVYFYIKFPLKFNRKKLEIKSHILINEYYKK